MTDITAFWERLDCPGHDAARLMERRDGWRLSGTAVFLGGDGPSLLAYTVDADPAWNVKWATIAGFLGDAMVDHRIERDPSGWSLDGSSIAEGADLWTLDFGFTPATNILQLRRSTPPVGGCEDIPALWFDIDPASLSVLPQRYHRLSEISYAYEAPSVGYAATLLLDEAGFVSDYPGLWRAGQRPR